MAWFRLEDKFYDHPKVLAAGNAAAGLWVRCATYSAAQELDGKVPAALARSLGSRAELAALTSTGLWIETPAGFLLPDFLEFNPSHAELERRRQVDAERKRKARAAGAEAVEHDPSSGQFVGRANGRRQ